VKQKARSWTLVSNYQDESPENTIVFTEISEKFVSLKLTSDGPVLITTKEGPINLDHKDQIAVFTKESARVVWSHILSLGTWKTAD
jgi:hypothetical protein